MIYQCYFRADQERQLFTHEPYVGFGLEPPLNPHLLDGCPELDDPATRLALCEYAAFLNLWRRPPADEDGWIGFTSYRQLDKSDVVFQSKSEVVQRLRRYDLLAWHVWSVRHLRIRGLTAAAAQSEWAHPGLHAFTVDILAEHDFTVPEGYFSIDRVPYASYWALRTNHFHEFMEWSWPLVRHALDVDHPYKRTSHPSADQRKAVGYFAERLFIIWMIRAALRPRWLGKIQRAPRLE